MKPFKFTINESLVIVASGESGTVIGRAEYAHGENAYLVRYRKADGCACEIWWSESALTGCSQGKAA